jgi:DNA-binding LacI/PurR family transcriptional regulator
MGFDDAHVWRPNALTSLRFPWSELGATAARALLAGGSMNAADRLVPPQLIHRASTDRPSS